MLERRLAVPKLKCSEMTFQGEHTFNMVMLQVLYEIDQGEPFNEIAQKLDLDSGYLDEIADHLLTHNIIEYLNPDNPDNNDAQINALADVYHPPCEIQQPKFPVLTCDSDNRVKGDTKNVYSDIPDSQFQGMGITAKLIVIMLLVSMIPLLLIWTSSYMILSSQINKDTEKLMQEKIFSLTSELNQWIEKNKQVLYAFSETKEMLSMDPQRQGPLLKLIQDSNPWVSYAFTLNNFGMNIARSDDNQLLSYKDRGYFLENLEGKNLAWQTVISKTDFKPLVVFSTPIRREAKIIGVLGIAVDIEHISKQIAAWNKGQAGFAFLLDDHYKIIAHQNRKYVENRQVLDHEPLITEFEKGAKGLIHFDDQNGIPSVGVVSKTQLGWFIAIQQEKQDALGTLVRERYYIASLLATAIGLVLIIAWYAGQAITRPVKELSAAADRISLGDSSVSINTRLDGELGVLALSVARMNESVQLALGKLRSLRKKSNQPFEM